MVLLKYHAGHVRSYLPRKSGEKTHKSNDTYGKEDETAEVGALMGERVHNRRQSGDVNLLR